MKLNPNIYQDKNSINAGQNNAEITLLER